MNKEQLLDSKKITNKEQLMELLAENLHLSFSSLKEVLEYFEELEQVKDTDAVEFLKSVPLQYVKSKKENTKKFLEFIREKRNPIMYNSFKELKSNLNGFKSNDIKVSYPDNLEGDRLLLTVEIRNEADIDNLIRKLEKNRDKLKRAINIVKKGG